METREFNATADPSEASPEDALFPIGYALRALVLDEASGLQDQRIMALLLLDEHASWLDEITWLQEDPDFVVEVRATQAEVAQRAAVVQANVAQLKAIIGDLRPAPPIVNPTTLIIPVQTYDGQSQSNLLHRMAAEWLLFAETEKEEGADAALIESYIARALLYQELAAQTDNPDLQPLINTMIQEEFVVTLQGLIGEYTFIEEALDDPAVAAQQQTVIYNLLDMTDWTGRETLRMSCRHSELSTARRHRSSRNRDVRHLLHHCSLLYCHPHAISPHRRLAAWPPFGLYPRRSRRSCPT